MQATTLNEARKANKRTNSDMKFYRAQQGDLATMTTQKRIKMPAIEERFRHKAILQLH